MTEPRPVALITGAARRVGAAIARHLHTANYDLALHCRHSRRELDTLTEELELARPGSTLALQADLAEVEMLPDLIDAALERFGRLDALVNNASAFEATPVGAATTAQWDALFASNARAPFFLSQAAAPALATSRGGIVNLVDIYAERPLARHPIYCMAKASLLMMTRALALDLAPHVRVNAIAPGAILWPENGKTTTEQQALLAKVPLGRAGTPNDVAAAVLWLLRDAPYVSGEVIRIDGGRSLGI
ncbi:pteridine reductase [Tahibacter aquaticus]|uniref:Pteridine reductase n=1 Tax=Tahibacter aquaticus TaxID=520092 RepID=A0A4V6PY91_9GAMM|nr:pteridine reductase [Tahibacter aquaticus]TDR38208.1 pteridine reductase [Tahibacter aquaticus]